jgi:Ser/Thr protein kinase RdoA (MazF antagonist)
MTDIASVQRVAAHFGWGPVFVERVRQGHINETFFVASPTGDYVLQRLNRSVLTDIEGITANILTVHGHISDNVVPDPIASPDGHWLVYDDDDVWRAFARVPDAAPVADITPVSAESAGNLLGQFHAGVADLDPARISETMPKFHDVHRRLRELRQVVEADPCGRACTVPQEIEMALAAAPLADLAEDLARRAPRRVGHNDAKLDNLLFRDGTAVCLVDLDTVMAGAWFWDVGDLLRTAATIAAEDGPLPGAGVVDPSLYDAVLRGYRHGVSGVRMEGAEIDAVEAAGSIVTYEQAIRFLTDWLAGDVYYRTSRPEHNRDRARAQLRLLGVMPRPESSW